ARSPAPRRTAARRAGWTVQASGDLSLDSRWDRTTRHPIQQLDRVHHRNSAAAKLGDAADIAGRDQVGIGGTQVAQLALTQSRGDLRLEHVVGARRTAADMSLPRFNH